MYDTAVLLETSISIFAPLVRVEHGSTFQHYVLLQLQHLVERSGNPRKVYIFLCCNVVHSLARQLLS